MNKAFKRVNRIENVIFMGTPNFAVPTLLSLISNEIIPVIPVLVVTRPDKKRGRGLKLSISPVKEFCLNHNIPVFQPQNINNEDAIKKIGSYNPDLIIAAAYGKIVSQKILGIPKFGCINLHPSLLPKYRGPSPMNWTLFNGEKETGNTVFFMTKKMDAGDIIYQSKMKILPEDNYGSLQKKLSEQGADDVMKAISLIDKGIAKTIPQDENLATFSRFIDRDMRKICWTQSAEEITNHIRGLAPYPAAFTYFQKREIKIIKAKLISDFQGESGQVLKTVKNKGIIVGTQSGAILLETVKPEGKKEMSAYAFSLGHPDILSENKRFGDEHKCPEKEIGTPH
ncbi:MAG: methionyl-tRNA formyltransferase [Candidatus Cloacimonetes bacterium]|nr:methionyl-tRNA formyltransferase [Candidatus Cloacimonadota bacterium]MBL7086865.1 methionyl-tRNA formyltransferase [Candidatus Cloacimonadota bacterium]